jgi:hypothetical protein
MKATHVIPESYTLFGEFNPVRYKKAPWAAYPLSLLVAVASYFFFNNLVSILRPDFQSFTIAHVHFEITIERLLIVLGLAVLILVLFSVHEGIHAFFLWIFTHARPRLVATLKGAGGFGISLPAWYLPRDAFLMTDLAPVVLITFAGMLLLMIVPAAYLRQLVFCIAIHLASSIGDIVSAIFVIFLPATAYMNTDGAVYTRASIEPEEVRGWQQYIRRLMEQILTKLE